MKRTVGISTLGLLICLGLASALPGQARRQTFESVVTLPRRNPATSPATLNGTVVSEGTGQPLTGARVQLARSVESAVIALLAEEEPGPVFSPVTTDSSGRFAFKGISAGRYTLSVRMDGFLAREVGARALTFEAGEQRNNFSVALTRSARIDGQIVNEAGAILAGIPIRLLDPISYQSIAEATSGQDGSYRMDGFSPANYVIVAGTPVSLNGRLAQSFTTAINIPNTNVQRMNIRLQARGIYRIRGTVSIPGAVLPPTLGITVRIGYPNAADMSSWTSVTVPQSYDARTGTFEIPNLLPGVYLITAFADPQTRNICSSESILISSADVTGVELALESCMK